jgi:hypothetical protein
MLKKGQEDAWANLQRCVSDCRRARKWQQVLADLAVTPENPAPVTRGVRRPHTGAGGQRLDRRGWPGRKYQRPATPRYAAESPQGFLGQVAGFLATMCSALVRRVACSWGRLLHTQRPGQPQTHSVRGCTEATRSAKTHSQRIYRVPGLTRERPCKGPQQMLHPIAAAHAQRRGPSRLRARAGWKSVAIRERQRSDGNGAMGPILGRETVGAPLRRMVAPTSGRRIQQGAGAPK